MSDLQTQLELVAGRLVDSGAERGLQIAVYRGGEQIVDVVAGVADPVTGRAVTADTPFYNYSILKGATATLAHIAAERGHFTYDTRVAELWPEFAACGKGAVTVRQVLAHTAGVPGIPLDTTVEDLCDWERMCAVIADSEPWWEPGTKVGYHAYTFGYLVGEVLRRATGRPVARLLHEELVVPLGIEGEMYFGMPAAEQHRLARLEDAPGAAEMFASIPEDAPMFRAGPPASFPTAALGNHPGVLAADIPAGGKASARAVARMYAALLGEVDGVRLLPAERLREATAPAATGTDEIFGMPSTWALGYALGGFEGASGPRSVFGIGGAGGSAAWADKETGVVVAVTKNRLTTDFSASLEIVGLVRGAV